MKSQFKSKCLQIGKDRNTKSLPTSRYNSVSKRNQFSLEFMSVNKNSPTQKNSKNLIKQYPKSKAKTLIPQNKQKEQPKQVSIKLKEIIGKKGKKKEIFSQTVHSLFGKQQKKKQKKQIKVSAINLNIHQCETERVNQNEELEYSFSKEYNKKSKTQSHNAETIAMSEITGNESNESNQMRQTQKRSIRLFSSSPSTVITIKQKQLSDDPLDNLQVLQRLINSRISIQEPSKDSAKEKSVPSSPHLKRKIKQHKFHYSLPISREISPLSRIGKQTQKNPIGKAMTTSPRQIIKNHFTQASKKLMPKTQTINLKEIQQKNKSPLQFSAQRVKNQKAQLFNWLNTPPTKSQLAMQQTPEFNSTKHKLLQQISNRPQINQSFLDPFDGISSVFEEMENSSRFEFSRDSEHDLQTLLNFETNDNGYESLMLQQEQNELMKQFKLQK